jgi:predicted negative regulator of RcsB-dependent stress response
MAQKQATVNSVTAENDTLQKAKGFWAKSSKPIIFVGIAVIVLAGGFLGYKYFYKAPREQKAKDLIFSAEKIFDKMANEGFSKDSVSLVLNGGNDADTKVTGLLKIVKDYSGTGTANRAEFMIGACYLHLKEFDKAIKYLKEFDGNGADQVQAKAYLMLGHAYAEQNKKEDAFSYYKKAANVNEKDDAVTPDALMTAGMYAEAIGKPKDAIELYEKVKENYPLNQVVSSGEVDKYLARLGIVN